MTTPNLETRTISLSKFSQLLERNSIPSFQYPAFASSGMHHEGVDGKLPGFWAGCLDVRSRYSPANARVMAFTTLVDDVEESSLDKIYLGTITLPKGIITDVNWLQAHMDLRRALKREGIPFVDEGRIDDYREILSQYIETLSQLRDQLIE